MARRRQEQPPDLRQAIARKAREAENVERIADAVIAEASGGPGGKGGSGVLKAYELVQDVLDRTGQSGGEPDYSRMTDDQLRAFIRSLQE